MTTLEFQAVYLFIAILGMSIGFVVLMILFDRVVKDISERFPDVYQSMRLDQVKRRSVSIDTPKAVLKDLGELISGKYWKKKDYFMMRYGPINYLVHSAGELRKLIPRGDRILRQIAVMRIVVYSLLLGCVLWAIGAFFLPSTLTGVSTTAPGQSGMA